MPSNTDRETLSAKITSDAYDGWRTFCHQNGVSVTAMVEVAGRELALQTNPRNVLARKEMIEKARAIDIERRARR